MELMCREVNRKSQVVSLVKNYEKNKQKKANVSMLLKKPFNQPFIPEFLSRTLPFLNLDLSTDANRGFSLKSKTEWQTV